MVHASGKESTHASRTRALVLTQLPCVCPQRVAFPTSVRVTLHARILDEGEMCLVKVEVERGRIFTDRSTDEFGVRSFVLLIRLDETVHAHIRLERRLYTIEVFHRDPSKLFHEYTVFVVSLVQRLHRWFQLVYVTSTMQGQTPEETQVISVPFGMFGVFVQTDDGFVLLDVDWKRDHVYTSYRMIDDAVDEKCDIGHEFAHSRRIRSLIDGPLQDVGFADAFEKVKILTVGDETGFVQVSSTAITRGVIVLVSSRVLVPQHESVTEVNLEGIGLFLVHFLQRHL